MTETITSCWIYFEEDFINGINWGCNTISGSDNRGHFFNVEINLPPKYSSPVILTHSVKLYETVPYTLPSFSDPNGDLVSVYLAPPILPFVTMPSTSSLEFAPYDCSQVGTSTFDLV